MTKSPKRTGTRGPQYKNDARILEAVASAETPERGAHLSEVARQLPDVWKTSINHALLRMHRDGLVIQTLTPGRRPTYRRAAPASSLGTIPMLAEMIRDMTDGPVRVVADRLVAEVERLQGGGP